MCSIDAHEKQHPSYFDDGSHGGGKVIRPYLKTEKLDSLCATFDFIDYWIKWFDQNYQAFLNMYSEAMQYSFRKIPVQLPEPFSHREKYNHY